MSTLALALLALAPQDFPSYGANGQRNGRTDVIGPRAADVLWSSVGDSSIISWFPFVSGGDVFVVRQSGFPTTGGSAGDEIVARDLETGAVEWSTSLAFGGNADLEWISWIAGVENGIVYASRSSNQRPNPIVALDAATGAFLWSTAYVGEAFAYDGVVFTDDGDLVVGDLDSVARIDGLAGATEWETDRTCPVSGNCGVALFGDAVYLDEAAPGGNRVTRFDLATGARMYSSDVLVGFTDQNAPFCGPDGTIFFSRSQNNPLTDFLYAFDDDGSQIVERWNVPVRWTTSHEHGVGDDGSVYTFNPMDEFVRLDAATGAEIGNAGAILPPSTNNLSPMTVVDGSGKVYLSNGWGSSPPNLGRMWCFSADLSTLFFDLTLNRQNRGGPALADDGVLVVADRSSVRAYREPELGAPLCTMRVPNSTGNFGETVARGSVDAADNRVLLTARNMPLNAFGYFLASKGFNPVTPPGQSNPNFCLSGQIGRYAMNVQSSGLEGRFQQVVDLTDVPQPMGSVSAMAGETWYFQAWHRDVGFGGMASSDFTHVIAVPLQ
ncbi:MAG: PQQ-binding-like beta-propeller repeat protein [Planctomycetota bacterium]